MTEPLPDVVLARAVRALTVGLVAMTAAALLLGALAVGSLAMSGSRTQGLLPLLGQLALGQAHAIAGAGALALGLRRLLASPGDGALADVPHVLRSVARGLEVIARILLLTLVLATAAWALSEPGRALGALFGAIVAAQVAVLGLVLARRFRP